MVQIHIQTSRWKKIWDLAKAKLSLLPKRILRQEQALGRAVKVEGETIEIIHSGRLEERRIRRKFYFFLQRQRTKHILYLIGETILLPISGLAALLPGPNVFFGVLAILMITHWQALRGINRILKKGYQFAPSPLIKEWEEALEVKDQETLDQILDKISGQYNISNLKKVLGK
jgi:hypothetical protein